MACVCVWGGQRGSDRRGRAPDALPPVLGLVHVIHLAPVLPHTPPCRPSAPPHHPFYPLIRQRLGYPAEARSLGLAPGPAGASGRGRLQGRAAQAFRGTGESPGRRWPRLPRVRVRWTECPVIGVGAHGWGTKVGLRLGAIVK